MTNLAPQPEASGHRGALVASTLLLAAWLAFLALLAWRG